MTKSLAGKVAIVTGASAQRGIGRATALKLASLGADLVLADLGLTNGLQALAEEIAAAGGRSLAVMVDVTDVGQIQACVEAACERFGGIDILVNNAGTTTGAKPFLEISDADWDSSYAVNLRGPAQFSGQSYQLWFEEAAGRSSTTHPWPVWAPRRGSAPIAPRSMGSSP